MNDYDGVIRIGHHWRQALALGVVIFAFLAFYALDRWERPVRTYQPRASAKRRRYPKINTKRKYKRKR